MVLKLLALQLKTDKQEIEVWNIWNLPTENDRLDSRAILLINTLRKWGVLPTGELICEMDEFFFQNFYHQIADLHIFGNCEIIDLIYS